MTAIAWTSLALVVLLGTAGQLALKYGLRPARAPSPTLRVRPAILIWFGTYVLTTLLWIFALRSIPLSQAFPILGLQFALIPLASSLWLDEEVGTMQWVGIGVIVLGVALVGST
jgi:undecaprenyl phosphate-alpha-L-ara4N flippase subunit ArnE